MSIATEITRLQTSKANLKTSIENKGVTVASNLTIDQYPALIDSISTSSEGAEEKDVNFYDYDGLRVYSYTKQEFLALTAMPENPNHTDEGLTSQGWNWSLSDAKSFVSTYDILDIGNIYTTTDDSTFFIIDISNIDLNFYVYVGCSAANTAQIEWGDGSSTIIDTTSNKQYDHVYSHAGTYKLKFVPNSSTVKLRLDTFNKSSAKSDKRGCVKKAHFGSNTSLTYGSVCSTCWNLEAATIPKNFDCCNYGVFSDCYSLKAVIIPTGVTNIGNGLFSNCFNIKHIILPNEAITTNLSYILASTPSIERHIVPCGPFSSISNDLFDRRYHLKKIVIVGFNGSYTGSINQNIVLTDVTIEGTFTKFYYANTCYNLKNITLKSEYITDMTTVAQACPSFENLYIYTSTPPTLGTNAFSGSRIPNIYVPASAVEAYKAEANWSTYADKIQAIPS